MEQKIRKVSAHTPHAPVTVPLTNIVVKAWQHQTIHATASNGTYMVDLPLKQVMADEPTIIHPLTENALYLVYTDQYPPMLLIYNGDADGSLWFVSH